MKWKVIVKGHWIGIIETNYGWAEPYWRSRGAKLLTVA